jgi:hypothetical protein
MDLVTGVVFSLQFVVNETLQPRVFGKIDRAHAPGAERLDHSIVRDRLNHPGRLVCAGSPQLTQRFGYRQAATVVTHSRVGG